MRVLVFDGEDPLPVEAPGVGLGDARGEFDEGEHGDGAVHLLRQRRAAGSRDIKM